MISSVERTNSGNVVTERRFVGPGGFDQALADAREGAAIFAFGRRLTGDELLIVESAGQRIAEVGGQFSSERPRIAIVGNKLVVMERYGQETTPSVSILYRRDTAPMIAGPGVIVRYYRCGPISELLGYLTPAPPGYNYFPRV